MVLIHPILCLFSLVIILIIFCQFLIEVAIIRLSGVKIVEISCLTSFPVLTLFSKKIGEINYVLHGLPSGIGCQMYGMNMNPEEQSGLSEVNKKEAFFAKRAYQKILVFCHPLAVLFLLAVFTFYWINRSGNRLPAYEVGAYIYSAFKTLIPSLEQKELFGALTRKHLSAHGILPFTFLIYLIVAMMMSAPEILGKLLDQNVLLTIHKQRLRLLFVTIPYWFTLMTVIVLILEYFSVIEIAIYLLNFLVCAWCGLSLMFMLLTTIMAGIDKLATARKPGR